MKSQYLMFWYKFWLETRVRFGIAFALSVSICLLYVIGERPLHAALIKTHPFVLTYAQYVYWHVFSLYPRGLFQLSGFVLGLSGWQRERRQGSMDFSLALPISRTRQVLNRAIFQIAQIVTIALASLLLVWVTSNLMHHELPLSTTLLFVILWTTGGMLVFALTFLCSVLFPSEYTALAVSYILYMFYLVVTHLPQLRPYPLNGVDLMTGRLGNVIDPHTLLWNGNIPAQVLAGHLAISAIFIATAIFTIRHKEL